MPCRKRWKFPRRLEIGGIEIVVIIMEELHKRIGIAFSVTTRIRSIRASGGSQQRRVFDQYFVGFIAPANPQGVWIFRIPPQRALSSIDFKMQFALPPRTHLRNREDSLRAVIQ